MYVCVGVRVWIKSQGWMQKHRVKCCSPQRSFSSSLSVLDWFNWTDLPCGVTLPNNRKDLERRMRSALFRDGRDVCVCVCVASSIITACWTCFQPLLENRHVCWPSLLFVCVCVCSSWRTEAGWSIRSLMTPRAETTRFASSALLMSS